MNESKYMWLFVFFDLPTKTKADKKKYTKFRRFLLQDGFIMMQYSIYTRICKGDDSMQKMHQTGHPSRFYPATHVA